jgi:hypothetical protein
MRSFSNDKATKAANLLSGPSTNEIELHCDLDLEREAENTRKGSRWFDFDIVV